MTITTEVRDRLSRMTLEEKVGQVFVFTWRNSAQAANELKLHPGGFIRIFSDALTVAHESAAIQNESATPLIMAADFERGIGGTIAGAIEVAAAMAIGATGDESMAYDAGRMIGEEALAIGINMDYAPVLDVNSNPLNPVINTRSFGGDPHKVATMGVAFMQGLHAAGVGACGKHFPGHGNTNVDSHSNLGVVPGSRAELNATELVPFRAAIKAGVDAIMSAHLLIPSLEPEQLPATLSKRIMTGLLRDELGFTGVAVTDALDMGAIAKNFTPEISIPASVNAGCDQLIMPHAPGLAVDILRAAVRRGEVSEDRLNEAVARVLALKLNRGILTGPKRQTASVAQHTNTAEHRARVAEIAEASITLVRGGDCLPLQPDSQVLCLEFGSPQRERSYYLEPRSFADHLAAGNTCTVTRMIPPDNHTAWHKDTTDEWMNKLQSKLETSDVVVLAVYAGIRLGSGSISVGNEIVSAIRKLLIQNRATDDADKAPYNIILASFGSPYVVNDFPEATTALCAFSETQASQRAMAGVLQGKTKARGITPVSLM